MVGRRGLLLGALCVACGKSRRPPPSLVWHEDIDVAYDEGRRRGCPVLIQFGASWDVASKELEHATFPDPEVAGRLATNFVAARVDCTDDENPTTMRLANRYEVKGTPTLIIVDARSDRELWRANELIPPKTSAPILDDVLAKHAALVVGNPVPLLHWESDPDAAMREAIRRGRPLLLFFGPAYDHGAKFTRDECFNDAWVARLMHDDFVLCDVWCDQGANAMWDRFGVRGTPTSIVVAPARNDQVARLESLARPPAYARFLRQAVARFRT